MNATLRFQTFVKYIFNEGNKMINVSEMKISLLEVCFQEVALMLADGQVNLNFLMCS